MLQEALKWLVDIGMAIGPILGYVSQYILIKQTKSVGSFSIDICGILLFANILRLNFYIFKTYESALVFQSIFMISMQIILLRECCKYSASKQQQQKQMQQQIQPALETNTQQIEGQQQFWRWRGFQKFGVTILFFVFCSFCASVFFKLTPFAPIFGQFVGILALMSQSILIAPQIYNNIKKQSTKGLSILLVTFNELGDVFKLIYFIANNQPFQFVLCGIIQVTLDTFVIVQIFYYHWKHNSQSRKKQPKSPVKSRKIKEQKNKDQEIAASSQNIKMQSNSSQIIEKQNKKYQVQLRNIEVNEQNVKKRNAGLIDRISQQFKKQKQQQDQQNYVEISDQEELQNEEQQKEQNYYSADTETNLDSQSQTQKKKDKNKLLLTQQKDKYSNSTKVREKSNQIQQIKQDLSQHNQQKKTNKNDQELKSQQKLTD